MILSTVERTSLDLVCEQAKRVIRMYQIVLGLALISISPMAPSSKYSHSAIQTEDRELDQLARTFRIQVYDTFRTNRDAYDCWRTAGDQVLRNWHKATRNGESRYSTVTWFRDAIAASESHPPRTVPPLPLVEMSDQSTNDRPVASSLTPGIRLESIRSTIRPNPDYPFGERTPKVAKIPTTDIARWEPPALPEFDLQTGQARGDKHRISLFQILGRAFVRAATNSKGTSQSKSDNLFDVIPDARPTGSSPTDRYQSISGTGLREFEYQELASQVLDYSLDIQSIQQQLTEPGLWTADRIAPLLDQLLQLDERRRTLLNYATDRPKFISEIGQHDAVVSAVSRRISEVRDRIEGGHDDRSEAELRVELEQLDVFAETLAGRDIHD